MANGLYDAGRDAFLRGDLQWKTGGHTFKAFLIDTGTYTVDLANHNFLDDIVAGARAGNSAGQTRADAPTLTVVEVGAGIADANNITFTGIPSGTWEALVIFRDDGSADATSALVAYIDTATGLPVTANGGDITIQWADTTNRIFKL